MNQSPVIETDRTWLRPFVIEDLAKLQQLQADPTVMQHTGGGVRSIEETERELITFIHEYAEHGYGRMAVIDKSTGELIGRAGIRQISLDGESNFDLGFMLAPNFWGRGYATEIVTALRDHAFSELQIPSLSAVVYAENIPSLRVLEKVGFRSQDEIIYRGRAAIRLSLTCPAL